MPDTSNDGPPRRILVVGGYGDVGGRVSELLAKRAPGQVVVAGRDRIKAAAHAARIGGGATAVQLQLGRGDLPAATFKGVGTVVVCFDDHAGQMLHAAVERGLAYVDITADRTLISRGRLLSHEAAATGARAVLGMGLAPGLTNLVARMASDQIDDATDVVVGILLDLYDEFGPQALDFMLEAASRPFPEPRKGVTRSVRPYTEARPVWFGPAHGIRQARWFPFPDQFGYPDTLGVTAAATLIALEPRWVDRSMAISARVGLLRLSAHGPSRRGLAWALRRIRRTSSPRPLAVSATATSERANATVVAEAMGESSATADVAATASTFVAGIRPGVWLPEEAFDPDTFVHSLSQDPSSSIRILEQGVAELPERGKSA